MTADRAWLPIDVDGYGVPAPWGLAEHLRDAARAIRDDALGEEFAGVTCVVAATATTGLVGEETARLKLCFLLNRLHPLADLERWAKGAQVVGMPVDPAVMRPGQPIYTSRPRFEGALAGRDPVPVHLRAFLLPGSAERVALDVHRHDGQRRQIESKMQQAKAACGEDWRRLLDRTLGGPTSFYVPLSQALGVAARSGDSDEEIGRFVADLLEESADHRRRQQYGRHWVLASLHRFRRHDSQQSTLATKLRTDLLGEEEIRHG